MEDNSGNLIVRVPALEALISNGALATSGGGSGGGGGSDAALDAIISNGALTTADKNLAALITSGKLKVTDVTMDGCVQGTRITVEKGGPTANYRGVLGSGQTLPGYTTPNTLIPAVAGKWIKIYAITVMVSPSAAATSATAVDMLFMEGAAAFFAWEFPFTLPATSAANASYPQGALIASTPPGFSYVTSQANVAITLGSAPNVTLSGGPIWFYVYYSYLSAAPY